MDRIQQSWEGDRYWLDVIPLNGYLPFTYGMWTTSLTGIINFVSAYPRLFFLYQVFVKDEEGRNLKSLALGGLHYSYSGKTSINN